MIVFDSSTLILTAKAELLDLFLDHAQTEVTIPLAVQEECCQGKKTLDALTIRKAIEEGRIGLRTLVHRQLPTKLDADFNLGRGEAEAMALALLERAQLVAIDDKQGINACKLLGISFTTAIAILIRSREKELIDKSGALTRLAALARYGRYRNSIIDQARRTLEELG